jgi:thiol-disulfide isomerase/thioredoxin
LTIIPADNRFVKQKVVSLTREPLQGEKLVGQGAPEVAFTVLSDGSRQELSDFRDQVVVLDFWASWCAPCMEHVAAMQTLSAEHPTWKDRVVLIAMSLDEQRESAAETIAKRAWHKTHNVWGDDGVKRTFDADLLPLVVILDTQGTVVAAGHPRTVNVPKIVEGLLTQ